MSAVGSASTQRAVERQLAHPGADGAEQRLERAAGAQHADGDEDGHQVGHDADGDLEALLGALDEGLVERHAAPRPGGEEQHDHAEQQRVGEQRRLPAHRRRVEPGEVPHQPAHRGGQQAEPADDDAVPQVELLHRRRHQQPAHGAAVGGDQDGHEDVGRVGGAELGAEGEDGHGQHGHRRGVDDHEQDHLVGGAVGLAVERLQLAHGLQAQRRGGVVEPERVGREVHHDGAAGGVAVGDAGEQAPEQRPERARHGLDHAALLADAHEPQPQAHDAGEPEGDLETGLRGVEQRRDDVAEDVGAPEDHRLPDGGGEGDEEERGPDPVQHGDPVALPWTNGDTGAS